MAKKLDKLTIKGFKSIKELVDFEVRDLNVLIGANGSGKSNFVEVFKMVTAEHWSEYITKNGGANAFLFNGIKETEEINLCFGIKEACHEFLLELTADDRFMAWPDHSRLPIPPIASILGTVFSKKPITLANTSIGSEVDTFTISIPNWTVYHFHDTSYTAGMRRYEIIQDNEYLRSDAANIAPFLLKLREKHKAAYSQIIDAIRLVTPFFDNFKLTKTEMRPGEEKVRLDWTQKGSDYPMQPYHFSDGTMRFICLVTALLQPEMPSLIVIDEPELGLHPYAIDILAELMKAASKKTQVIVSTQSPALVDSFEPEDVVVVNRKEGASTFERLDKKSLKNWLKEYSLGELWRKNVIAGGPVNE